MPISAHPSARTAIGTSIAPPASWAESTSDERGCPRNTAPNTFTKHAIASPPTSASAGAAKAPASQTSVRQAARAAEQTQVDDQLADQAVQRRQAADRDGSDQEGERGRGHPPLQAAQPIDLAGAGGVLNRACAEEEQGLEETVVPDVEQSSRHAEHDQLRASRGAAEQRDAQPEADDPDVLHAVIREQPLQVVLADGAQPTPSTLESTPRASSASPHQSGGAAQSDADPRRARRCPS